VADDRSKIPLIDIVSVVIAPVLVMMMVGSLVFFLIEVLQGGRYEGRLQYTFFFFVIAAVLVARISIRQGMKTAIFYGVALAAACFIAMLFFVQYDTPLFQAIGPVMNVGLMALVWWSAHKLTWDCTQFDEDRKASGRGLLSAAGLDRTKATTADEDDEEYDPDRSAVVNQDGRRKKKNRQPLSWWERYQKYREWRKKKPHTPGVWVLYFALAALPLFALGQALIPAEDSARRSSTFWQMAIYIGSALGLLMTTTLLGLRRYVEDRNASISTRMTATWLTLGGVLIVAFLVVGALMPRPHSETPLFTLKGSKKDRQASKNAQIRDQNAGNGDGAKGEKKEAGNGQANAKGGKDGGKGDGQKAAGAGKQQNKQGGEPGKQAGGEKGSNDNKGQQNNQKGNDPNKQDQNQKQDQKQNQNQNKNDPNKDNQQGEPDKLDGEGEKADAEGNDAEGSSSKSSETMEKLTQAFEKIGTGFKWIVWIVLAVVAIVGGIYFVVKHLANFTDWAKGLLDWFRGLFRKKPRQNGTARSDEAAEVGVERPPPFDAFSNPFADGSAKQREPRELIEYTFLALEAWAWDRSVPRESGETATEFVARLGEEYPKLDAPGQVLAKLSAHALYSRGAVPKDTEWMLPKLWAALEGASEPAGVE
jgi:hypothetical protein